MVSWHRENDPMFLLECGRGGDSTIGHLPEFLGGFKDEPPLDVVLFTQGAMRREENLGF